MRRQTITKPADLQRAMKEGRQRACPSIVVRSLPGPAGQGRRLSVVASRRLGKAVVQNRIKRVAREAFWSLAEGVPDDTDYVIIARVALVGIDAEGGMLAVRERLAPLVVPRASRRRPRPRRPGRTSERATSNSVKGLPEPYPERDTSGQDGNA
jgi:ribonuclease P protein component